MPNNIVALPERRRKVIQAPPGLEFTAMIEQETAAAIRRNECLHATTIDLLLDAMGDATEMVFPDGSYYTKEKLVREGFQIEPGPYPSLTFHKAPK